MHLGSNKPGSLETLGAWPHAAATSLPHLDTEGQAELSPWLFIPLRAKHVTTPPPVITAAVPVTQAERTEASLSATCSPTPPKSFSMISGSESARLNVISDSLGDGQLFPKLLASVWNGTFWSHRRANQGALTPALPA